MMKVNLTGDKTLFDFIKTIPRGMRVVAMRAIGRHYIESKTSDLRREPPYKYFKFKDVYGGWFSQRQQGYVMAMIHEGKITPGFSHRSHEIRDGWRMNETDDWRRVSLLNDAPGVNWVKGDNQARMMKEMGWTPTAKDVEGGLANAMREAQQEVNAALQSKAFGKSTEAVGL